MALPSAGVAPLNSPRSCQGDGCCAPGLALAGSCAVLSKSGFSSRRLSTVGRWIGAILAFAGLAWIVWPTNAGAPPPAFAGLMVVAAIGWGIYSLVGRNETDPLAATAANFICAAPIVLIVWVIAQDGVTSYGLFLAIVAGAITSGLGYTLWYSVLPRLERSVAAIAQLTVPVIALVGGAVFLGEAITLQLVIASAVVLGGVALGAFSPAQRKSGSKGS